MSEDNSGHDLLHQLRIDRAQRDDDESRPRWPWIVGAVMVVLIIAGGIAAFALRGHAATVETSTAVAAASSGDAAVLQATGYVVARRQATISAQIIG
ncbi:MAG: efflux RND transporter periplasmic adaptor subunit, partial [Xanthomonadaceae bacterium]|nr:efflux RND transporter periplasmic adaptor subunit [Xanthomonadaceae bacterium]